MGWGSTPTPYLPLPPHIGKCARAPGAWCGIGSTRNRVPNALYFVRIREDLGELGRVQVPPPAPPRGTCQIGSARPPEGAHFRRRRARASGRPREVPGSARKRWEGGKMRLGALSTQITQRGSLEALDQPPQAPCHFGQLI